VEFHAGLEQAIGVSGLPGEYIWKYTHNGYDFSILGATPIHVPVAWDRSKILIRWPGRSNFHGFSALMISSVAARYCRIQRAGLSLSSCRRRSH
jgi:hypothetical protein